MPKVVLNKSWKDGHKLTPVTPEAFTQLITGNHVKGGDFRVSNGTVNWYTIEFGDGSYVSIDDNGPDGVLCTYVTTPR